MRLSAIIPTRDRHQLLDDALATLVAQVDPPPGFEVVVIDDGSEPSLADVVARHRGAAFPIRHVRQEPSGLNVGRNRGAAEAEGDVLAFLDDDVLVDPGWAAATYRAFADHGADGMAGRIRLKLEGDEPRWLNERLRTYLSELDRGDEPHEMPPGATPWGANCAVTRAGFEAADSFTPGLDRLGKSLVSNGDKDFFERVRATGGRILYWPEAWLWHRVPADRLTTEFFVRRARAQGVSDVLMDQPDVSAATWARELVRVGRTVPIAAKATLRRQTLWPARFWFEYCRGRAETMRKAGGDG